MTASRSHKKPGFVARLLGLTSPVHQAPTPDARVTPDGSRCVQCGVCGYNCPVGIPVRDYARQGQPVVSADCVQCGQCIEVCPRGTLSWGRPSPPPAETSPELEALLAQYFPSERPAS